VLLNLGVANEALGRRAQAAEYYRQSFALNETFGEQLSAARARANAAAILIEYGIDPKRGLSDVNVALGVFQSRREAHFEVLARQLIAAYHRYAGDHGSAEHELNLARSVAGKNNLDDEIALINIDQGRSRLEMAQYAEAGRLFEKGLSVSSGGDSARARIHLAQARTMLGELDEAETFLRAAQDDLERRADTGLNPLLYLSRGVLAYERERTAEARTEFGRAAALWTDEWPDAASVEASAYAAALETTAGQTNLAERTLRRAIAQADTIQRLVLQVKCRLALARLYVQRRRFDDALRVLDGLPSKDESRIGLELLAKASYWRSQSLLGKGDITGGRRDAGESARLLEKLRALVPEASRPRFDARPDIQAMLRANGSV
jgi:tetratricopeptide (TPR) repeat protein